MVRLKNLVNLILEDSTDEIIKIARSPSGFISPKGEVYAIPELGHADFLVKQPKYKNWYERLKRAKGDEWATVYNIVLDDALRDGWVRISGSRGNLGVRGTKKAIARQSATIEDIVMFAESVQKTSVRVYKEYV